MSSFKYWKYNSTLLKTSNLNEEVNCIEPSPSVSVLWSVCSHPFWLNTLSGCHFCLSMCLLPICLSLPVCQTVSPYVCSIVYLSLSPSVRVRVCVCVCGCVRVSMCVYVCVSPILAIICSSLVQISVVPSLFRHLYASFYLSLVF